MDANLGTTSFGYNAYLFLPGVTGAATSNTAIQGNWTAFTSNRSVTGPVNYQFQATGPLGNNDYRDDDTPDATIRVDWATGQRFTTSRPDLWNDDNYTVLASDRDPLSAVTDQPQSLERE